MWAKLFGAFILVTAGFAGVLAGLFHAIKAFLPP